MSLLPLPQSQVVTHDWDYEGRPQLANFILTINGQPLPDVATENTRPFTVPAKTPRSCPSYLSNVGQTVTLVDMVSAGDALFDLEFQDLVLAFAAKLKKTLTLTEDFGRGMHSFLPYFVSACVSRCFRKATCHDNTWIALHKYSARIPDCAHLVDDYIRVALVVTTPLPHLNHLDQLLPAPHDVELSDSQSEQEESVQPYSTLSEMLAQEIWVEDRVERYDWKYSPVAPKNPAMHRVVFAADLPAPALCVVVVAEREVIGHAMSSALYHRLAWGVRTPLLGLSFYHDSSLVNLHVGWLEGATEILNGIPRVHILGSGSNSPRHGTGWKTSDLSFYLDDPNDVLVLSRILLSLHRFIEDDCQAAHVVQPDAIIPWRADQEPLPKESTHAWSHETISNWSKSIIAGDPNALSASCDDDSDGGLFLEHPTAYSFDQFVALKERNGFSPTAVSLWLMDRFVVFHPLPPIATSYDLKTFGSLMNRFQAQVPVFDLYRTATCFKWPRAWQTLGDLPALPRSLSGLKHELFCAIQLAASQPSYGARVAPLPQEADLNLEQELSMVLRVCALARSLKEASSTQPYSYCYDMLFSILPPCDAVQLLPGVTIRLSRSSFLDKIAKGPAGSVLSEVTTIYNKHCLLQTVEVQLLQQADRRRYYLLRRALQRFGNDNSDWPANCTKGQQRVLQAPTSGTCDSAIAARFHARGCPDTEEMPAPAIVIGQSPGYTCPAYPIPHWPAPEIFSAYTAEQRTMTYDIMATAHHDYPSSSGMDMEDNCTYPTADDSADDRADDSADDRADDSADDSLMWTPQEPTPLPQHDLDVPVLFVVHSAQRARFHIADSNRLRVCLTSAVHFLASLQILDFPLFGLLTEGTLCAVVMAWCSQYDGEEPLVHFLELNCTSYDISVPAGALNLATFLHWLYYVHVPQLLARLDDVNARGDLPAKHGDDGSMWSAEDQLRQLERGDPPFDQVDQLSAEASE